MSSFEELAGAVTGELRECLTSVSGSSVERAVDEIARCRRVFLAGSGRSGAGIRAHAVRLVHMGKAVHVVGDVTTPPIAGDDLLLVGSGSGRTASLVNAGEKAKQAGARVLVVTIDPESPLAALADHVVEVPAPAPKVVSERELPTSVQPMGNLFEQALFILLDIFVMLMMEREGMTSEEMFGRHANLE